MAASLARTPGVNVVEIYGQTETAGAIITGQRGPFPKSGNVGTVPEQWQVKLGGNDEILVKSGDLFDGYWNNEQTTREAFTEDGWLRTGDVGRFAGGSLQIVDRARDFIVTSGGKTLSPSFIENLLRASPYVAEAMVTGARAQVPHGADRDRLRHRGRLGARRGRFLHRLHQPRAASRSGRLTEAGAARLEVAA